MAFDANHKNDPVLVDDPQAARNYCTWRGLGLPTEAQFEFASRVATDGTAHDYPWGDAAPTCDWVSYAGCGQSAATPVGTTAGDVSAYGVKDLAGSVPEWVADSYDAFAGCLDCFGWSDICAASDPACPGAHCTDATCVRGCLPPAEDNASTMQGAGLTDTPECAAASATDTPLVDPIINTQSDWAVVRGAGALDRKCGLAGWTRRHAAPGSYHAGFRCAKVVGGYQPNAPATYRFALAGCPSADYPVTVSVATSSGTPIDFVLDHVGATGSPASVHADGGAVRMMPCGDTFIVRPAVPALLAVTVNDTISCAAWSQTVGLDLGGDVPARGVDTLPLAGRATNQCTLPNAMGSCAGICKVDTCSATFKDCDGAFANGCEVDVSSDLANCGACHNVCPSEPNATIACISSGCRIAGCSARFADCNHGLDDGCEVDTGNDPSNCGACATVCSANHIATPVCSSGSCGGACDPGYADCNSNKLLDGCEVGIATDVANCGGCATACSQNHVTATCSAGQCGGRCVADLGRLQQRQAHRRLRDQPRRRCEQLRRLRQRMREGHELRRRAVPVTNAFHAIEQGKTMRNALLLSLALIAAGCGNNNPPVVDMCTGAVCTGGCDVDADLRHRQALQHHLDEVRRLPLGHRLSGRRSRAASRPTPASPPAR